MVFHLFQMPALGSETAKARSVAPGSGSLIRMAGLVDSNRATIVRAGVSAVAAAAAIAG